MKSAHKVQGRQPEKSGIRRQSELSNGQSGVNQAGLPE
jgi:hypothetical protein